MGIYSQGLGWGQWGSVDEKLLRGNIRVDGDSGQTNLMGFFLKAGQGDQPSPEGVEGGMKNRIRYRGWSDMRGGRDSG